METKLYKCRGYLFCLYELCKMSCKEINEMCGVSHWTIWFWLRKFNIKREKPLYKDKKWLYQKYIELKMSTCKIGRECEVSGATIRNWLRKFNIPRRSISEAQKITQNRSNVKAKKSKSMMGKNKNKYKGENSSRWKEWNEISKNTKHHRMKKILSEMGIIEPEYCPDCNEKPETEREMHLMNIDHKYRNKPHEWFYICEKCHKGIYHSLAGLGGKTSGVVIKPIPNLINNLLELQTRTERYQLLKICFKSIRKDVKAN